MLYSYNDKLKVAMDKLNVTELKPEQAEILPSIIAGDDVVAIMPTGGGKSLLYQIPSVLVPNELTIVVSPLIALQQDQLECINDRLKNLLYRSLRLDWSGRSVLNSSLCKNEHGEVLQRIREHRLQILFLAPEQLQNETTRAALAQGNIVRVVVDEAHVIDVCHEEFRESYLKIGQWISELTHRPQVLALSATMTEKARAYVQKSLGMVKPKVFRYPMCRKNLRFSWKELGSTTMSPSDREHHRLMLIEGELLSWKKVNRKKRGAVIIYCNTPAQVGAIHTWLQARKWSASLYHGKLGDMAKAQNMRQFMSGDVPIMIANGAFGMGVDKADIRNVIHAYPPLGLCDYVQMFGRAGRDGKKSKCVLYYSKTDWSGCKKILKGRGLEELKALQDLLKNDQFDWDIIENHFTKHYTTKEYTRFYKKSQAYVRTNGG